MKSWLSLYSVLVFVLALPCAYGQQDLEVENLRVPLDNYPDGTVKTEVTAEKAKMKDNQAFIREKAMERKSIDEQIQEKTKEIEHLSKIMVELIESEQAKMADFEMKNDTMNAELMKLREESKTLQQDFNNLFQNMGLFHKKFEKYGDGGDDEN